MADVAVRCAGRIHRHGHRVLKITGGGRVGLYPSAKRQPLSYTDGAMMYEPNKDAGHAAWSRRYETAIRQFLGRKESGSLLPAERLGREAVPLGLETLDVARVHVRALEAAIPPEDTRGSAGQELLERADAFFKETIVPIEATHRAALKADSRIDLLTKTLRRRTAESSASDDQLEQAITQREAMEAGSDAQTVRHAKLLAEAQRMQKGLRDRMREILSEQEGERKRFGGELRDEIAQALLAIDLSLLALKTSGHVDTVKAEKSIAEARKIMEEMRARGHVSVNRQDRV